MMFPNNGLSATEQLERVALALTANEPAQAGMAVDAALERRRIEAEIGPLTDRWVELHHGSHVSYVCASKSGRGDHADELPAGEQPVAVIDGGDGTRLVDWFRSAVARYEAGDVASCTLVPTDPPPGDTSGWVADEDVAIRMRRTADWLDPGASAAKLEEFRTWVDTFPYPTPQQLVAFSRHLARLHPDCAVDGAFTGQVTLACRVAVDVPAATSPSEPERVLCFLALAEPLLTHGADDLDLVLDAVVARAVEFGATETLKQIVDSFLGATTEQVRRALDADSVTEHLHILHAALPRAIAAQWLNHYFDSDALPDQHLRNRSRHAASSVDETLVRLRLAVVSPLVDIVGAGWSPEWVRARTGQVGIDRMTRDIDEAIERHWHYPRSSRAALLAVATDAAAATNGPVPTGA